VKTKFRMRDRKFSLCDTNNHPASMCLEQNEIDLLYHVFFGKVNKYDFFFQENCPFREFF
jgi:hypothetical protein